MSELDGSGIEDTAYANDGFDNDSSSGLDSGGLDSGGLDDPGFDSNSSDSAQADDHPVLGTTFQGQDLDLDTTALDTDGDGDNEFQSVVDLSDGGHLTLTDTDDDNIADQVVMVDGDDGEFAATFDAESGEWVEDGSDDSSSADASDTSEESDSASSDSASSESDSSESDGSETGDESGVDSSSQGETTEIDPDTTYAATEPVLVDDGGPATYQVDTPWGEGTVDITEDVDGDGIVESGYADVNGQTIEIFEADVDGDGTVDGTTEQAVTEPGGTPIAFATDDQWEPVNEGWAAADAPPTAQPNG